MSVKKSRRKIETRTILYILIVIIIIGGAYIFITSQPASKTYYDPIKVLNNKEKFVEMGEIIIEGYYDADVVEGGGIVSTSNTDPGSEEQPTGLRLDITNVENTSKLQENVKLHFTGTLVKDETDPLGNAVIFQARLIDDK